jgi:hypothetical protein
MPPAKLGSEKADKASTIAGRSKTGYTDYDLAGRSRLAVLYEREEREMRFETPTEQVAFEIPDEWWQFAEMDAFSSKGGRFYPYRPLRDAQEVDAVPLSDIEPPMRNSGVPPFKKYKMVPILFALCSPECALPPVKVDACIRAR